MLFRRLYSKKLMLWGIGLAATLACEPRPKEQPETASEILHAAPSADSLVASNAAGVEVWFTLSRVATGSDGKQCVERGLEIRRSGQRIQVPLLYTRDPPILLNDTTMRALLWNQCRPGDAYLVDLRSGRPVRERPGSKS
jgi:hypothetical protein